MPQGTNLTEPGSRRIVADACRCQATLDLCVKRSDAIVPVKSRFLAQSDQALFVEPCFDLPDGSVCTKGDAVHASFTLGGETYSFRSKVVKPDCELTINKTQKVQSTALLMPRTIKQAQRREAYRVSVLAYESKFIVIHDASRQNPGVVPVDVNRYDSQLVDLSTGGAAVVIEQPPATIRQGALIFIAFSIDGREQEFRFLAEVRHVRPVQHGIASRLGVQFLCWPDDTCFKSQLRRLGPFVTELERMELQRLEPKRAG